MSYTDVMLDVETFSTTPDSILLQVGAVAFSLESGEYSYLTFLRNVSVVEQLLLRPCDMDEGTVSWWRRQSDQAKNSLLVPTPVGVVEYCDDLTAYLAESSGARPIDQLRVWAKGTHFDIPIAARPFRMIGRRDPWNFRMIRDSRTYVKMVEDLVGGLPEVEAAVAHSADSDCVAQVKAVVQARNALKAAVLGTKA